MVSTCFNPFARLINVRHMASYPQVVMNIKQSLNTPPRERKKTKKTFKKKLQIKGRPLQVSDRFVPPSSPWISHAPFAWDSPSPRPAMAMGHWACWFRCFFVNAAEVDWFGRRSPRWAPCAFKGIQISPARGDLAFLPGTSFFFNYVLQVIQVWDRFSFCFPRKNQLDKLFFVTQMLFDKPLAAMFKNLRLDPKSLPSDST